MPDVSFITHGVHRAQSRVVEVQHKEVPVVREVEQLKITERLPSTEEMLRRIRYDPRRQCVVYKSPDTGRVIEVHNIPDVAVDHVRPGKEVIDQLSSMAHDYMIMDNANLRRVMEANPNHFFDTVRQLAGLVRTHHAQKGSKLPRLRRAGVEPVHVAPK
jgi:hypothetical protein